LAEFDTGKETERRPADTGGTPPPKWTPALPMRTEGKITAVLSMKRMKGGKRGGVKSLARLTLHQSGRILEEMASNLTELTVTTKEGKDERKERGLMTSA